MTAYDFLEYPSKPFLQCYPDRLALMGRLFGISTADPSVSRVLEIGCGDGLNLIAAAITLPQANFTGIDLSEAAITRGRQMVRELGRENVHLELMDLRGLQSSPDQFDYVIAHGLYSWIPAELRDALMAAIRTVLCEDGIAFVSYSAYPGAYLRQMVREMARISSGTNIPDVREWLATAPEISTAPPVFRVVLADECADMLRREDGALFHDDLAEVNQPLFFRDFVSHAAAYNLQYVSEADPGSTERYSPGEDRIKREQLADLVKGRRFRQTLLCHAGRTVNPEPEISVLENCHVGGPLSTGVPSLDGKFEYVSRLGARLITESVEDRMILESAATAWPCYIPADDLGHEVFTRLLHLFANGLIDIRLVPPPVSEAIDNRPIASSLARLQAKRGLPLTSLHHVEVPVESTSLRNLLPLVDGTRTRSQLIRDLRKIYPSDSKQNVALAVDTHLRELQLDGLLLDARNKSKSRLSVTRVGSTGREPAGR